MTECLFQYDRLYLNAAYHEPDEHRHLLSHMIIGVSQRVRCSVNHYEFEADGVCIDSDVLHTACVTKGSCLSACPTKHLYLRTHSPADT